MSLLEKAKSFKGKSYFKANYDDIELAFAWLKNEVSGPQIAAAYNMKQGSSMTYKMAIALKTAFQQGLIKIVDEN